MVVRGKGTLSTRTRGALWICPTGYWSFKVSCFSMTFLTDPQTWRPVLSMVRILRSVLSSWDYIEQQWIPKGKSEMFSSVCPPICPFRRRGISVGQLPYLFPDLLGYQLGLGIAVWAHLVPNSCLLPSLHLFRLGNHCGDHSFSSDS